MEKPTSNYYRSGMITWRRGNEIERTGVEDEEEFEGGIKEENECGK